MTRVVKLTCYLLAVVIALAVTCYSSLTTTEIASPHALSYDSVVPARTSSHNVTFQPVRLIIPSIKVDASIESVGVLPN